MIGGGRGSYLRRIALAGTAILAAAALTAGSIPPSDLPAGASESDWPAFGRTYGEQHYSPLDQINDGNVGSLKLAWYVDLPAGNSVSGPIEVGGVLYTATGYSVVRAFNAATGRQLWEYDPHTAEAAGAKLRNGWGIRGLAWWNGHVIVGTHDGRLISINARTGKPAWSSLTVPKDEVRYITGAPRVFGDRVIIGHGGGDMADIRGYVTTYDARTGKQLWRFHTVPGDPAKGFENDAMEMAAKTWSGEWWKFGGGGTVWNAMTYDAGEDTIILGTGNGAPWNHRVRSEGKGDNLFLCSIVGLDAKTGAYKWHYQINPGESWDYNAAMDIQLADLMIEGQLRKVLMTAPKNGFFYVINRTNGKLISAEPFAKVSWATKIDIATGRPVEVPNIRYDNGTRFAMWPGPVGAHSWIPMSYDNRLKLAFIPKIELPAIYDDRGIPTKTWKRSAQGVVDPALNIDFDPPLDGAGTSALVAWDVMAGKPRWTVQNPGFWNGGTMATAGNLVFQGQGDGHFNAYDARTGKQLWRFAAGNGVLAPPISYRIGGKQYVTVLSGFGVTGAMFGDKSAQYGWDYREQQRRILTFTLTGKAKLPPAPPPYKAVAFDDPDYRADAAREASGQAVFGRHCIVCHGINAVAGGLAPDLRASPIPLDRDALNAVVRQGILVSQGMPAFSEMSEEKLDDLRNYVRARADEASPQTGSQVRIVRTDWPLVSGAAVGRAIASRPPAA